MWLSNVTNQHSMDKKSRERPKNDQKLRMTEEVEASRGQGQQRE
jgi:hypothetical protein